MTATNGVVGAVRDGNAGRPAIERRRSNWRTLAPSLSRFFRRNSFVGSRHARNLLRFPFGAGVRRSDRCFSKGGKVLRCERQLLECAATPLWILFAQTLSGTNCYYRQAIWI
ncbi:MAG: hypothetical protein OXI87_05745 [Albidovulum sp.]|nr:hypothetical protein [Albidovulum sp.]MDE0534040.1 hypothetical protein [Albidovulum sp.]